MAGRGRVPYTFPVTVAQGEEESYRQEVDADARIERAVVFFPKGTRTDLQLSLIAAEDTINQAEEVERSAEIPDYIVGSGTTYTFDISVEVFQSQEIGVDANNVSSGSDLDAFVAFTVQYVGGNR